MRQRGKPSGRKHPTFGQKVRWWRESRGYTVNELSRRANVAASLVSAYELGKQNPTYERACLLADALEVYVGYIWDHGPTPSTAHLKNPAP